MRITSLVLFMLGSITLTLGCSSKPVEAKRVIVKGKVNFEGKPLQTGKITFDIGGGQVPASFDILDGSYEGRAPVGNCKVTITSFRKVSMKEKMKMDGPGYDQQTEENMLPDRYNMKSDITREIVESGPNEFNFDLKAK